MKIPLNINQGSSGSTRASKTKVLEHDILAAKSGDWKAKGRLAQSFMPLITSLAEKRSSETAQINNLIEAGKEGLNTAAKKYKKSMGGEKFRLFALDYIEAGMDRKGKGGGFFSRLFK
jgi:DNA-directed RNA polymerase specialized sigma subunit